MSTGSRVIAPSWLRGRKIEEGLLEVTTDKTQVSIVGPLSAEQVAAPGSLGASPSGFIAASRSLTDAPQGLGHLDDEEAETIFNEVKGLGRADGARMNMNANTITDLQQYCQ
jgi:hypothetical protein